MTSSTLGQRIAAKRSELGLSQSALGEQLGVSRQSVFKWESDAAIPEIDKLINLSRLFGVTLDWLLGMGEMSQTEAPPPEEPTQDFTEQEKQILEQLSMQKPAVPQWLKAISIIAVSCAAVALVNSCISLYQSSRSAARTEAIQTQMEKYAQYIQNQILSQAQIVSDFSCQCIPSLEMDSAEACLTITPHAYREEDIAELTVLLNGEPVGVYPCKWNGTAYETCFTLHPVNGYQFLFQITDGNGNELSQELTGTVLENLAYNLSWPSDYTVDWEKLDLSSNSMTFTDMGLDIPLPGVFRNSEGLWEQCELVLADASGTVLDRFDLIHRSQYSQQINFSGADLDFTTRTVELTFQEQEIGEKLHLFLNCTLSTGHKVSYPVEIWQMTADGLTANFSEARDRTSSG